MKNLPKMPHYTQEYVDRIFNQSMEEYYLDFKVEKGYYKKFDKRIDNREIYPYTLEGAADCMVDFIKALKSMGMNYDATRFLIDQCEDYDDKPLFRQYQDCFGIYPRLKLLQFPMRYDRGPNQHGIIRFPNFFPRPGTTFRDQCDRVYYRRYNLCKRKIEMGYSGDIPTSMELVINDIRRFFKYVLDVKEYLDNESEHFEHVAKKYDLSSEVVSHCLEELRWCGYYTIPGDPLGAFRFDVVESYYKAYNLKIIPANKKVKDTDRFLEMSAYMLNRFKQSYYADWNAFRKEMETDWARTPYQKELLATNRAGFEFPADPKLEEDIPVLDAISTAAAQIWRHWSRFFPRVTGRCLLNLKKGRYSDGRTAKGPIWGGLLEGQYYYFMHLLTLEQLKYESKLIQTADFFDYSVKHSGFAKFDFIEERKIDPLKIIYTANILELNALHDMFTDNSQFNDIHSSMHEIFPYYEEDFEDALSFINPYLHRMMLMHREELEKANREEQDEEKRKQRVEEIDAKYRELMKKG